GENERGDPDPVGQSLLRDCLARALDEPKLAERHGMAVERLARRTGRRPGPVTDQGQAEPGRNQERPDDDEDSESVVAIPEAHDRQSNPGAGGRAERFFGSGPRSLLQGESAPR